MTSHEPSSSEVGLLPCPFCGGEPQLVTGGPGNWYVRCLACKCATDDVMSERAVALWNARPDALAQAPTMPDARFDAAALQAAHEIVALPENWTYIRKKASIQVIVAREMARAALPPRAAPEPVAWREAAAAPTDGKIFWAMEWCHNEEGACYWAIFFNGSQFECVETGKPVTTFTHWMHIHPFNPALPAPPAALTAGAKYPNAEFDNWAEEISHLKDALSTAQFYIAGLEEKVRAAALTAGEDICECPRCGRMHRDLGFGRPPASRKPISLAELESILAEPDRPVEILIDGTLRLLGTPAPPPPDVQTETVAVPSTESEGK